MSEKSTHYPKPVSYKDAEHLYDRLMATVDSLQNHRFSRNLTRRDEEQLHFTLVALQSMANELYIASHSGVLAEGDTNENSGS